MIVSWLARRRRGKLLAGPFPAEWTGYLERNVPLYTRLNERERGILRDHIRILVAEKNWEGCGGLAMTDEVKVTIAAHAAVLLLGIEHDYFARVMSILVYPTGFRSPEGWQRPDGVVDLSVGALGQAWYDGPVVLAWDSVLEGGRDPRDGLNVVLHEFAHQLDYLDGMADGTPPLRRRGDYARWQEVMTREFERLKVEAGSGTPRVLDAYGAVNHAEFFAVATEAFFEKSREMCVRHPELYAVLSEYYGQDPAARDRVADPEPVPDVTAPQKPRRTSRKAACIETHARVAREWPWWVQFWEIHPGVSRSQALRPLGDHITYGAVSLVLALGLLAASRFDWRWRIVSVNALAIAVIMVVLALWLRMAVRWVDRHGNWGGEYRPATGIEQRETSEEAPLG
jgi:Mlc titration factor MtfA (ptsG expression regulator)